MDIVHVAISLPAFVGAGRLQDIVLSSRVVVDLASFAYSPPYQALEHDWHSHVTTALASVTCIMHFS
jgi:hypothetical protein